VGPRHAFEANDNLYVTTGNSEESQVLEFGPYSSGGSFSLEAEAPVALPKHKPERRKQKRSPVFEPTAP